MDSTSGERLQKILARAGVASRRAAEELIVEGRVTVNGKVVRELGSRADPASDVVAVDGEAVRRAERQVYLMLHKPAGYVTTRSDPENRPTIFELAPEIAGLISVGRLDIDTEGLLLLTTDGDWAERLAHPRYGLEREYEVSIGGAVAPAALELLREGIMLEGKPARPVAAYQSGQQGFTSILTVVMAEGRRREVRLLCAAAGLKVRRLVRRRMGSVMLGFLLPGHWRHLDAREVQALASGPGGGFGHRHRGQVHSDEKKRRGWAQRDTDLPHRDRRPGGVGQIDHRPQPGRRPGLPVSGHRGDVSGRNGHGPTGRDRPR